MRSEKSHLLTTEGTACPVGTGYMKSILDKRQANREQSFGGIVGGIATLISVCKNASSFFFH